MGSGLAYELVPCDVIAQTHLTHYPGRITGPLWAEATGHPSIPLKHCDTELWWSFVDNLIKSSNKQSRCRWFETSWCSCDVTLKFLYIVQRTAIRKSSYCPSSLNTLITILLRNLALSTEAVVLIFTKILKPKAASIAVSHIHLTIKTKIDCLVVPTCAVRGSAVVFNDSCAMTEGLSETG